MTGEEDCKSMKKQGNRYLVCIKLDSTGRELLTWTLAKFTNAGDRVIALHVASSLPQADALRNKLDVANQQVDELFDSVAGVYESFCSIKQVDLEVEVTNGPSLKKVLVEEAKRNNAIKLILGAPSRQTALGSSFSLAKYCSKRLPLACSVLVIQHGRIMFEKEGSLKDAGDKVGMLNKMQKSIRSHSWKGPGQHLASRKASASRQLVGKRLSVSEQPSDAELDADGFHEALSNWSHPSRFIESPASALYACKYVPVQVLDSKRTSDVESPTLDLSSVDMSRVLYLRSPTASCLNFVENSQPLSTDDKGQEKTASFVTLLECKSDSQHSTRLGVLLEDGATLEQGLHSKESHNPVLRNPEAYRQRNTSADECCISPAGWPLLHRSISMNTINQPQPRPRRLSVVEWALQLPDRPKEVIKQHTNLVDSNDNCLSPLEKSERKSHSLSTIMEEQLKKESLYDAQFNASSNMLLISTVRSLCQDKSCIEFNFFELKSATDNFSSENLIGKGGCSEVYRGYLMDGQAAAVKCLNASAPDSEEEFVTEVEIISGLHHCRIVELIGYCISSEQYLLVYNLATEGNLEQKLHAAKVNDVLSWDARFKVAVGVAEALNYLHDGCARPVIHRDVKSSNILLSADLEPQLTDFGLAKYAPATSTQITCSDVVGTFGYLAPEYFMFGKVNEKTDVYSFGVVLLELITGKRPIETGNPKGQENLVLWAKPLLEEEASSIQLIDPKLEGTYNDHQLKRMMIAAALCLRQSPNLRPRVGRILDLLTDTSEDVGLLARQDSNCKEADEGYESVPGYGDRDIRNHLTLALLGLDDDGASQGSIDHSINFAHSNKFIEEYLGGRYSRSSSFE